MSNIKTQEENPNGLHQRYVINKLVKRTEDEMNAEFENKRHLTGNHPVRMKEYKIVPPDDGAEYFVLRLDTGGSDLKHIEACRIGIHAYADAIYPHLPELAIELKARYPLLSTPQPA